LLQQIARNESAFRCFASRCSSFYAAAGIRTTPAALPPGVERYAFMVLYANRAGKQQGEIIVSDAAVRAERREVMLLAGQQPL